MTNFAANDLKNIKTLLDKKVFVSFNDAIKEKKNKGLISETTFIGINSANIKDFNQVFARDISYLKNKTKTTRK